jgi:hypothetical protein
MVLDIAAALACGSAPCPVCLTTGTDADGSRCRACGGTATWHPYPWTEPGDGTGRAHPCSFTIEESAIITAAPSVRLAWIGYAAVYGPVRSLDSIRSHFDHCRRTGYRPAWSEAMEDIVETAPTASAAILTIREQFPTAALSDKAISHAWGSLHHPSPEHAQ